MFCTPFLILLGFVSFIVIVYKKYFAALTVQEPWVTIVVTKRSEALAELQNYT